MRLKNTKQRARNKNCYCNIAFGGESMQQNNQRFWHTVTLGTYCLLSYNSQALIIPLTTVTRLSLTGIFEESTTSFGKMSPKYLQQSLAIDELRKTKNAQCKLSYPPQRHLHKISNSNLTQKFVHIDEIKKCKFRRMKFLVSCAAHRTQGHV